MKIQIFILLQQELEMLLVEVTGQNIDYFHKSGDMKGMPTKMHVILIMWAYSPYEKKIKAI